MVDEPDVRERFAPVRERFAANFDEGHERGASVSVTVDGEPVVDLWAGDATTPGDPWERDTIVNVLVDDQDDGGHRAC